MKETKLFEVLKTLGKKEFAGFGKFVASPFFVKRNETIRLFSEIKKFYPEFESESLSYKALHKKLYKNKTFNGGVIRKISSELYKMAEEYLAYINFRSNRFDYNMKLLNEFSSRRLDSMFETTLKDTENNLAEDIKQSGLSAEHFAEMLELNSVKIEYFLSRDLQQQVVNDMASRGENLVNHFIVNLMRVNTDMLVNQNMYNASYDFSPVNDFLECFDLNGFLGALEKNNYTHYPLIAIHCYSYLAYKHCEIDIYYEKLKELFDKHKKSMSIFQRYSIYLLLENACTCRIIAGKPEYLRAVFEIYKQMLDENIYLAEGEYMPLDFARNILITAMKLKEYDWAEKFIKDSKDKLAPARAENMYDYCMARLYYEKGDIEKALETLNRVKYEYFLFRIDVKNLTLKIYYDMGLYEEAQSLIDSYKHLLSKHEYVSETNRNSNLNFLKYYNMIFKIKMSLDDENLPPGFIKNKIEETSYITNKNWLLEKLEELK